MFKYLFALIALTPLTVLSATVINYDDGSTYTLEDNQEIYISTPHSILFKRKDYKNKNVYFTAQEPWSKRDYVPDEDGTDDHAVGSHEWCKAYVPWHDGLTFNMIAWQRFCDTDNDGDYDEDDDRWDE